MEFKDIKSKKQYLKYLKWVDEQFNSNVDPNSKNGKLTTFVLQLIKKYEDLHYPIPSPKQLVHEQTNNC
jgi:HTH-type transcriptional regulator/antitoxin HigA